VHFIDQDDTETPVELSADNTWITYESALRLLLENVGARNMIGMYI
jgi:hypothetical protein